MKRRNLFGVIAAASGALMLGRNADVRFVEFTPPHEQPMIRWVNGHIDYERFAWLHQDIIAETGKPIPPSQVKQGWATFKLKRIGIYLSDAPQPNFEPITYWIPTD